MRFLNSFFKFKFKFIDILGYCWWSFED